MVGVASGWWAPEMVAPTAPRRGRHQMPCQVQKTWMMARRWDRGVRAAGTVHDRTYDLLAQSS
jgi:hypothetical protein